MRRARGLPRSAWGTALAHAGLGVTLLGLAATGWGVERIASVKPGETVDLGPLRGRRSVGLDAADGPELQRSRRRMPTCGTAGGVVATIEPSKRFFTTRQMTVAEAGIVTLGLGQVYISLGDRTTTARSTRACSGSRW